MKHLKMLGLAAIAALGLMAFVGAGTASATTLSTDAAGTTKYAAGTEGFWSLKAGSTQRWVTTSGTTVAMCTESTAKGSIGTATGTWVGGAISSLTWGGCSQTTTTLKTGSLEIMQTSGDAGTVVGKGSEVTMQVFGVSCAYGYGEGTTLGTVTGGAEPELSVSAVVAKTSGGFLCGVTTQIDYTWIWTIPHAVHIVS